jgi:hypothetical protein
MAQSTESFIESEVAGYTWQRRSRRVADKHVLWHTDNWLNALPEGVRPVHLQQAFPRIANDLARLWSQTPALDSYFEDQEFSPREDRHGFSPVIKDELLMIHVYSLRTRSLSYEERAPQRASLLS